jgi:hypothetical protein
MISSIGQALTNRRTGQTRFDRCDEKVLADRGTTLLSAAGGIALLLRHVVIALPCKER